MKLKRKPIYFVSAHFLWKIHPCKVDSNTYNFCFRNFWSKSGNVYNGLSL